ncbi:filamentous hemagglutinin N-terminal domain-containing protein [Campylobacter subantarcticus]|uniref:Hemagglutinin domain-containing protein n=1 Tax=Campylobacter subantarcticus LMG 24374 TaxID=1388751 RepID=A0A0A8HBV6_9BACT|nr:filamentous hemagglutinin N-terminal domain-containing protein [Campylobacter subantarcticus]AJC91541.1 hemagglutinin domain-containing protein [Campylobacter subantarcticus LMG 24374]
MKKLTRHIMLSGITVSLLFSPLMATTNIKPNQLPSGGKFTHGTSGSINTSGNTMTITGDKTNSVIQWGGGFSIGKDAQVNFINKDPQKPQNYLNIAHGTSKSIIEGVLNANNNNVFLINPNGVIITKTGTINANRFVASTTSMSDADMDKFANMKTFNDGLSFSPVFKPSKTGNVVNMGNINANDVLLIGNKVDIKGNINGMHNDNVNGDALKNPSGNTANKVHLVGNDVLINIDSVKAKSIIVSAYKSGALEQSTSSFYENGGKINGFTFQTQDYDNVQDEHGNKLEITTNNKFKKYATIASDVDWFYFAKGWNENEHGMRDFFDTYKLVDDIDFGASEGKNYAHYCISDNECTSMIVGTGYNNAFNKTFDGQGYTLKNINIDTTDTKVTTKPQYVGIFGYANKATFKNINVDYMGGGIKANGNRVYVGGFIGESNGYGGDSTFTNISLSNIDNISGSQVGGFIGDTSNGATFSNISLNGIKNIKGSYYAGGFIGDSYGGTFSNISLKNITSISSSKGSVGGFIAYADVSSKFDNIILDDIDKIEIIYKNSTSYVGGFAGYSDNGVKFTNISLNNLGNISGGRYVGGFIGHNNQKGGTFTNISLNNIGDIGGRDGYDSDVGGFAGYLENGDVSNISLNGINSISGGNNGSKNVGGFIGNAGNVTFTNISLSGINSISGYSYTGGFIGQDSRNKFNNIYIYFDEDAKITGKNNGNGQNGTGKFYGWVSSNNKSTYNDIHIYYKDGTLSNATASSKYENKNKNNSKTNGEINLHTYDNKTDGYNQFLEKANTIGKPIVALPSKPEQPDVSESVSSDVKLDKDDLNIPVLDDILNDILNGEYSVSIDDLGNIKFTPTDKITLDSVKQSLDFLNEFFKQEGMEELLSKFESDLKNKYDKALALKDYLQTTIKSETQGIVNEFNAIKQAYEEELKKYNYYVNLLNEGKSIDNFDFTESAKKIKEYKNQLDGYISDINDKIATKYNQEIKEQFKYTDFTIKNDLFYSNMQIPNQPSLPDVAIQPDNDNSDLTLSFEQTSSFNLKGDEAIKEEEQVEVVEETSLTQKGKICIVSDNYKTMNSCLVSGM